MITLLLHHVLVKPNDVKEVDDVIRSARAAGLAVELDKREQKAVERGVVVQIGPTAFKDYGRDPDIIKVGETVVFARYGGKEIKDNGETFLLLNDEDVLCTIKEENNE